MNEKTKKKEPQLLSMKTFKYVNGVDNQNALKEINNWIKKQYKDGVDIKIVNISSAIRSYPDSDPDYFYNVWYYKYE